jgi:hypothetical protein
VELKTPGGVVIPNDDHHDIVAFSCPTCGYPVLVVLGTAPADDGTRRIDTTLCRGRRRDPVECRRCLRRYWVDKDPTNSWFVLHRP